ncbi:virulence factor TspB C-terminal domain-related protein, partial [Acinetobacter sp. WCHAc060025]|uniref:virulence factor TspB C-terminal domain-related protein n=1 Tax=Acinetobacter sp. WCHAc060025 TaxID=2518625 RepID=UPI0022495800
IDLVSLPNPAYDPSKDEEKTLPLDVVANQVISNAEAGDTNAQVATTAAAADIVNDAQNDDAKARPIVNQLEANAETKTEEEATGQSKPNTETGATDLSLTFPVFCGWAPVVCEAAQTVISFPQTLTNWWDRSVNALTEAYEYAKSQVQAVRDYFKDEPPKNDDTALDIPDPPLPDINTDINFGGACPVSKTVPISFAGISTEIEFSFQPLCDIASFIKPVVITISAFSSALIIAGIRENE